MKPKDLKIGMEYMTNVSGVPVRVRLLAVGISVEDDRFQVERVDSHRILRLRTAAELHPI